MEAIKIPRRFFKIDIDGKVFVAKELSVAYLEESMEDSTMDTAELAIADSIGEISKEDQKYFGLDTKNLVYAEIVKFTFQEALTASDLKEMSQAYHMNPNEIKALDRSAQIQMKNIMKSRQKRDKAHEKK